MLHLIIFAIAFLASAAPPGPDTLTVFSRGLQGGFAKAIPFSLGVGLAKVSLLSLAIFGVAEVAQRFETAFLVIKFAGAAYLIALGIKKFVRAAQPIENVEETAERSPWSDLLVGLGLGISNPNAVVFYVALLPSVVDIETVTASTYVSLIAIVVTLWLVVAAGYAGLANRLRTAMKSAVARRRTQRVSGAAFLGAGLLVATR